MDLDSLAEWVKRQGYHVIRTDSSLWYRIEPTVYQAFPFHWVIDPSEEELSELIKRESCVALRFSAPLSSKYGQVSYHVVRSDKDYGMNSLGKKARYDVRKGLSQAQIEPISFSRLAEEGWTLREETMARQGRVGAEKAVWWKSLCMSADGLPGFEAWGAIMNGELEASLFASFEGDCCSILYQQSRTAHLKDGVNHALTFAFTREILGRPEISRVFYGLESLDAPASVDQFKFRLGYHPVPVRQRFVFHPLVAPFVGSAAHAIVRKAHELIPSNRFLAKSNGLMRFYLGGLTPIERQKWPNCVQQLSLDITSVAASVVDTLPPAASISPSAQSGSPRIRVAKLKDAKQLGRLHIISARVQPNSFMHQLGLPFFNEYYKILLREKSSLVVCATNERDRIIGLVSGSLDSEEHIKALRRKRTRLVLASIPAVLRRPSIIKGLVARGGAISSGRDGSPFIVGSGPREEYWGWDPGVPNRGGAIMLQKAFLDIMRDMGAKKMVSEIDQVNRKAWISLRMLGARIIKEMVKSDGTVRLVIELDFESASKPGSSPGHTSQ